MSEKLKKQSVIISLIWAFVGTIGVVYYIKIGTEWMYLPIMQII